MITFFVRFDEWVRALSNTTVGRFSNSSEFSFRTNSSSFRNVQNFFESTVPTVTTANQSPMLQVARISVAFPFMLSLSIAPLFPFGSHKYWMDLSKLDLSTLTTTFHLSTIWEALYNIEPLPTGSCLWHTLVVETSLSCSCTSYPLQQTVLFCNCYISSPTLVLSASLSLI